MTRRLLSIAASVLVLTTVFSVSPARAIDEPDRLWLVGEKAFADGLYPLARRALERFADRYPRDPRAGAGLLMLGKARLQLGDLEPALDAFRRAEQVTPPPGSPAEVRFWEGETLFRLKRYPEARAAYDEVLRTDANAPFAPDALYGYAWTEIEIKHPEAATTAFRDLLQTWPDHALAPSATYHLARVLVELKRASEALPLLANFPTKYAGSKLVPDAQYLLGVARLANGDAKGGIAAFKAFVEANPTHERVADARKQIMQAAVRTGDKSQLQQTYTALMTQTPPTPAALAEAATIAGRLGRTADRNAALKKLLAEFPTHPTALKTAFDLASAAFKRKDWKEAATYGEAAAKTEDGAVRAEALLFVGESELKLKHYPAAAKAFQAVGEIESANDAARYRALAGLGLAREEQRELRGALTAYEAVAKNAPDAALRDWARQRATAVKSRLGSTGSTTKKGK